ncbi:hypothetical protein PWT90_08939 [Aphanocladium album]|nr:hypothetical protein PWT90_08939 [Aphanocladium album]
MSVWGVESILLGVKSLASFGFDKDSCPEQFGIRLGDACIIAMSRRTDISWPPPPVSRDAAPGHPVAAVEAIRHESDSLLDYEPGDGAPASMHAKDDSTLGESVYRCHNSSNGDAVRVRA